MYYCRGQLLWIAQDFCIIGHWEHSCAVRTPYALWKAALSFWVSVAPGALPSSSFSIGRGVLHCAPVYGHILPSLIACRIYIWASSLSRRDLCPFKTFCLKISRYSASFDRLLFIKHVPAIGRNRQHCFYQNGLWGIIFYVDGHSDDRANAIVLLIFS